MIEMTLSSRHRTWWFRTPIGDFGRWFHTVRIHRGVRIHRRPSEVTVRFHRTPSEITDWCPKSPVRNSQGPKSPDTVEHDRTIICQREAILLIPRNTRHRPNDGSMLFHLLKRWSNVDPALSWCLCLLGCGVNGNAMTSCPEGELQGSKPPTAP